MKPARRWALYGLLFNAIMGAVNVGFAAQSTSAGVAYLHLCLVLFLIDLWREGGGP